MTALRLSGVKKRFGQTQTIHGIDLAVDEGEFVVFVGPSGCGKSTLLRMIAGLETTNEGQIHIAERNVTSLHPSKRKVAMVFQSYALYPHMTAGQNLSFGMKMRKVPKDEIARKVAYAAQTLQLEPYLQRKPGQLSGGQCQRVAIGRALVQDPDIFLFDEPLSNLDAELRVKMRLEIAELHQRLGATMVYVTHDQTEAMTLADRIVVLRDGKIEQVGTPMELYINPENHFVAGFIGSPKMNFINVAASIKDDNSVCFALTEKCVVSMACQPQIEPGQHYTLGVRPEHLRVVDAKDGVAAKVTVIERLGASSFIYCHVQGSELCIQSNSLALPEPGDIIGLDFPPGKLYLFSQDGQTLSARKEARQLEIDHA